MPRRLHSAAVRLAAIAVLWGLGAWCGTHAQDTTSSVIRASEVKGFRQQPIRLAQIDADLSSTGNPSTTPMKWSGLLLSKDIVAPDGTKYNSRCTGQFIAPSVILTAAHCIQGPETGVWFDPAKMYFLHQYQNSDYSRAYRPLCVARYDGWFPDQTRALKDRVSWDYAMMLVDGQSQTGHFNWEIDWNGKYQRATMTGYPTALLKGQIIQQANGVLARVPNRENLLALRRPDHPNLREGTSGGAWVANFSRNEGPEYNLIISVSSFYLTNSPETMFGPYLTADFRHLLDYVSRRCTTSPSAVSASPEPTMRTALIGTQNVTSVSRVGARDLGLGRSQLLKSAEESVSIRFSPEAP
jgi:hypothetical protein